MNPWRNSIAYLCGHLGAENEVLPSRRHGLCPGCKRALLDRAQVLEELERREPARTLPGQERLL